MQEQNEDFGENLINSGFTPFNVEELTKETILDEKIFNHMLSISDSVQRTRIIVALQEKAKELKVIRSFDKLFKAYQTNYVQQIKQQGSKTIQFTSPPIENLKCGKWDCKDTGITKAVMNNFDTQTVIACSHPILPTERLINVDSETEKIKLAFYKDKKWQYITVDRSVVANKGNIIQLADRGIEVNSDNSRELVSYIADIVSLNMQEIPVNRSTDRLGWIGTEFAPYQNDLKYDGDIAFKDVYGAVKETGDYEQWKDICRKLRKESKVAHILLASSFASPILEIIGSLPFIVHIWGGTGAGKTVGLMLAMSVWGNPDVGKLVRTLNSTQVALSRYASFVHDLPFAGDELQTIKSRWDSFDSLVMFLTEGVDRGRGKAYGGIEQLKEWNCCFLFTGEEPITKSTSGGGVKNRVIEIEATKKVIDDGNYVSNFLRKNYGHAGKEFINNLPTQEKLQEEYRKIFKEIIETTDTTDKQAMAMATIILADKISTDLIFQDESLTIQDIQEWLTSSKEVDVATRAYEWTLDWINQNINKFTADTNTERWGKVDYDKGYCYINKSVYVAELNKVGFDYTAIIRKFAENEQIERNTQGKFIHQTHVYGIKSNYVKLKLEPEKSDISYEKQIEIDDKELPF